MKEIMIIIINKELKLKPIQLANAVANSAVRAYHLGLIFRPDLAMRWFNGSYAKIIVKTTGTDIQRLLRKYPDVTSCDKDKNGVISMAFMPLDKENMPTEFKDCC